MKYELYSLACFVLLFFGSCGESTPVGAGLLEEEDFSIDFTDGVNLTASTVTVEPSITFTKINFFNTTFLLGMLDDPIFGRSSSSIYFEVRLIPLNPDFARARVDSVVLMIELARDGLYGDTLLAHQIEVFRLRERIDAFDTIFSNQSFAVDPLPLGVKNNYVLSRDSMGVFDPVTNVTQFVQNVLRIRLDKELGTELISDPTILESNDNLMDVLNGLYITSEVTGSSMLGLSLPTGSNNSGLFIYYNKSVDTLGVYPLVLTATRSARVMHFEHDYTNSPIQNSLDMEITGDEPLYIQGMSGVETKVDISDIRALDNIFINHALLEFFVATDLLGDTSLYTVPPRLSVLKRDKNGRLIPIDDVFVGQTNNNLDASYGGLMEMDEKLNVYKYSMNITAHAKKVYKGEEEPEIYLSVFGKSQRPERVMIYGPNHSMYPAKLRITFTNP